MARTETPLCDFGRTAPDFKLPGVDGRDWRLADCRGERGTLVMFICNHCPYVKAIRERLVQTVSELDGLGVRSVAIMSNDPAAYPQDSFANMRRVAEKYAFQFPYLLDEDQYVARVYGAVCTPDFFGYDSELGLQYRGRLDAGGLDVPPPGSSRELFAAMSQIARGEGGPRTQIPGIGCSIKWRHD